MAELRAAMREGGGKGGDEASLSVRRTEEMLAAVARSCVGQPAAQRHARFLDSGERRVVVVPAEGLDLLEDVEVRKIAQQFFDEAGVEIGVEGIGGEVVLEVVEDLIEELGIESIDQRSERLGSGIH